MKKCLICKKLHKNKTVCSLKCRDKFSSIYNKKIKLIPPSRKGIPWKKDWIDKRQKTRKILGLNRLTPETIKKIQAKRKIFYDKVGRKSNLTQLLKRTTEYKEWRRAVFERDNYTCQECGKSSGHGVTVYLHADHIKPKAIIIKECGGTLELCLKYSQLWDIKNGRTLCRECHRKTPTYGLGALKWGI